MKKEFGDHDQRSGSAVGIGDQRAEIAGFKLPLRVTMVDMECFRIRDKNDRLAATCEKKSVAEFIAASINSHADMLAELNECARLARREGGLDAAETCSLIETVARAAIARAEGR